MVWEAAVSMATIERLIHIGVLDHCTWVRRCPGLEEAAVAPRRMLRSLRLACYEANDASLRALGPRAATPQEFHSFRHESIDSHQCEVDLHQDIFYLTSQFIDEELRSFWFFCRGVSWNGEAPYGTPATRERQQPSFRPAHIMLDLQIMINLSARAFHRARWEIFAVFGISGPGRQPGFWWSMLNASPRKMTVLVPTTAEDAAGNFEYGDLERVPFALEPESDRKPVLEMADLDGYQSRELDRAMTLWTRMRDDARRRDLEFPVVEFARLPRRAAR